jgi:predicted NUDIX family phosphoesterase
LIQMKIKNNDIDKNIEELEKLSEKVLKLKADAIPRRPIIIEFCGSPKSGKSSCINSLDLFLRRNNFRTKVLTERASVCPVTNKYDPYFNFWTVSGCIAELSEVMSNRSKDFDIVLVDRGIFDAICWFTWLLKQKHFDRKNYNAVINFLTMSRWRSIIDLVYTFIARPDVSLNREYANLLTRKTGSIMKTEILESYKDVLNQTIENFKGMFRRVEYFDTSEKELNDVNYEVTKNILNILHDSTSERIGYFNRSNLDQELPDNFAFSHLKRYKRLKFDFRHKVEENPEQVQPIPISVITNKERNKILVVKKNKGKTSTDSPELEKILLYLGGHVREEDCIHCSNHEKDLLQVLRYTLQREIKEETGIDFIPDEKIHDPLCIWIKNNDRSKKHLAICYIMETNFDAIKVKLDKNEFVTSGKTKSGSVIEINKIAEFYNELEDWSKIILKNIFDFQPPSEQVSMFKQI